MRRNLPVTQREYPVDDNVTLMSATDLKGRLRYANEAFLEVSGFSNEELLGQPHNIVRHPDMPQEAFVDMWDTLKGGLSWTALVKNRRRDGDHYWVRANATPVRHAGQVVGYLSVRTRPTQAEIDAADARYARCREDGMKGWAFYRGLVVRTGIWSPLSWLQKMPLVWRIRLTCMAATLPVAACIPFLAASPTNAATLLGVIALSAVSACAWLEGQIAVPLRVVLAQALSVAAGQPGERMHLNRVDEIGMLLRAVNQAGLNLRALIDDVGEQVAGLTQASSEISQGNDNLSGRTEQAAASLQETAASMDELNATVRHNADSARQAAGLVGQVSEVAGQGGEAVTRMVVTMGEISSQSGRVADIVGVIDSIAFQTNILALNASVEAARAGEQGRGFAVVASEVRALAQRSATAAKEIKGLISHSVGSIASGQALAQTAGSTMGDLVAQVRQVHALVSEITSATGEQSAGLGQIAIAVSHLDQMTQQNAVLVEQSAQAAAALEQRTRRLAEAIGVYRS